MATGAALNLFGINPIRALYLSAIFNGLAAPPMLVLMVLFTTAGLWILSLPIAAGQVITPTPPTGG